MPPGRVDKIIREDRVDQAAACPRRAAVSAATGPLGSPSRHPPPIGLCDL